MNRSEYFSFIRNDLSIYVHVPRISSSVILFTAATYGSIHLYDAEWLIIITYGVSYAHRRY